MKNDFILESLNEYEKKNFDLICRMEESIVFLQQSIFDLSKYLYKHYNKKVIILIDEYDVPIQEGYLNGYYDNIASLIRLMFNNTLKGNEYIEFAVLTGVLRVGKKSMFGDLNNVEVYGISDKGFNEYFGFTESETKELLKYYDLELNKEVKNMYDGYNFNDIEIYNPWSIIKYCKYKDLISYWVNTSGNSLLMKTIKNCSNEVKAVIEKLLIGEEIEFKFNEKITYLDYNKTDVVDNVINLFITSGYLTLSKRVEYDDDGNLKYYACIPNKEVRVLFKSILSDILNDNNIDTNMINNFVNGLINNDKELVEKYLNKMLISMSFMDSGEKFYHGYILGIFNMFINDKYIVKSNREAGEGRFDLMIEKKDRTWACIIEFKITHDDMEAKAKEALNQIEEKEYYKELLLDKVERIDKHVFIFKGKKAIVR